MKSKMFIIIIAPFFLDFYAGQAKRPRQIVLAKFNQIVLWTKVLTTYSDLAIDFKS
jgi:hypothetical protein